MKYNLFTFDKIIHYFQQGIHEKKPELLYIVLPEEYKKTIQLKKKVYGFTEDWIALSSLTTGLDRGYTDGYAYIKEQIRGSLKKLETHYIQKVNMENGIFNGYANSYYWLKHIYYDVKNRNLGLRNWD